MKKNGGKKKSVLFNPATFNGFEYDEKTKQVFLDTIAFFEHKGMIELQEDRIKNVWQEDWQKYQGEHDVYSTMLTPAGYGDPDARYDLYRLCAMSELLAFYSQSHWYTYQVSILGVGPVWMGNNENQKKDLGRMLKAGGFFAFGMSEKEHGADLYSNECTITPTGEGTYVANGNKYYIGNANISNKVAILGKNAKTGDWVFWAVDSQHRNYDYVKDIFVNNDVSRVCEFEMIEYPITENEILKVGDGAFSDGLSTVNIGKFNCGWASLGSVAHSLYEAVTHANRRIIYGKPVTNFPHIRAFLSEAFCRANAMKLYSMRALDYFRMMSADDRRYLLFNPIIKNKVCREGGVVTRLIMDVVCAKGYEYDTYISTANLGADQLTRLEGTAHVNMALVLKFMKNYFFNNKEYPEFGIISEPKDDRNVFEQTQGGLANVQFPDYKKAYTNVNIPNVNKFFEIVEKFRELLEKASPDEALQKNMGYMLNYGEIFSIIVYAQLILEASKLHDVADELIDQIFALLVKDANGYALAQLKAHENSEQQTTCLWDLVKISPTIDEKKDFQFWEEYVQILDGAYIMPEASIGN